MIVRHAQVDELEGRPPRARVPRLLSRQQQLATGVLTGFERSGDDLRFGHVALQGHFDGPHRAPGSWRSFLEEERGRLR